MPRAANRAVTYYRGLEAQLVFVIAATGAKRELNLVLAMGGMYGVC